MFNKRQLIRFFKLLFIVLWMILIFLFSSDNSNKSSSKSDQLIINFNKVVLRNDLSKKEEKKLVDKYSFLVRKTAHFTLYFILGFLVILYILEYIPISFKSLLIVIIIVFLYAVSDEVHQLFVSGRSCEIRDIFIDTLGGMLYPILYFRFKRNRL